MKFQTRHTKSTWFFLGFAVLLLAVITGAAAVAGNGTIIEQGATVFIGEEGLNVTHALNGAYFGASCGVEMPCDTWNSVPNLTQIGWWASAGDIYNSAPSRTIDLSIRYTNLMVSPSDFVGYTGNWYLLNSSGRAWSSGTEGCGCTAENCTASLVFTVQDPSLDIKIWDYTTNSDVTGMSVPQGEKLDFQVDTNLYAATDSAFRGNAIDTCPRGDMVVWNNGTIKVCTSEGCGTWDMVQANQSTTFTDWVGWSTWSPVAGQGCYASVSNASYWNPADGLFYQEYSFLTQEPGAFHTNPVCGGSAYLNPAADGFIDIRVRDEADTPISEFYNQSALSTALIPGPYSVLKNFVNTCPWFWGSGSSSRVHLNLANQPTNGFTWDTGALNTSGQPAYPAGIYTIWAESRLNNMRANYVQAGADYTGKTVSTAYTTTLVPDTVTIEADNGAVTRGNPFAVTITGMRTAQYYLWVNDTSSLTGGPNNQAPMIALSQTGVTLDPPAGPYVIGSYQYENGGSATIKMNVGTDPVYNGVRNYALIRTSTSGTRTVEFETDNLTRNMSYSIRVERMSLNRFVHDEVTVTVERDTSASGMGVYRPSIQKFILKNGAERTVVPWGLGTDTPVTGDWNGDGMGDVGVYRSPIQKFILKNGTERTVVPWGLGTDTPVSGDWDGDGMGDVGVYRQSIHKFILKNGTERTVVSWGLGTDIPVSGDWDGDGMSDVGVFRSAIAQFILKNGTERTVVPWGLGTDTPVSGDWNADGLTDVGVYRPSIATFILKNGTEKTVVPWGLSTDIPVTGRWR